MTAFFDTSVLVAASRIGHVHHAHSLTVYQRYMEKGAACAAHSLAEVYSTLTGAPPRERIAPELALEVIHDISRHCVLVALESEAFRRTVESAVEIGLAGGAIYDSVLGACALKANAEVLYTWNTRDFLRLPPAIANLVRRPDEVAA